MKIPIVNEQDEIIGEEERAVIHRNGLKHREIHVWLITPEQGFIFQKRGLNQDTWPGFFDVTCGGHVDLPNETYEECARRELKEETGVEVPLTFILKKYSESFDPNTNTQNNAFRATFAGIYKGRVEDLKIENDAGLGFQVFSLEDLKKIKENEESKKLFIPRFLDDSYADIFNNIINNLFTNENQS